MQIKLVTLPLVSLVLVACGGGGSEPPILPPQTYSLEAAAVQRATTNTSFTVSAVDGTDTYSLTFDSAPGADEVFEGVVSKKALNSVLFTVNGAFFDQDNWNSYYSLNPYFERGTIFASGGYDVASRTGDYPTAAKVGDSGPLANLTTYEDATKTTIWGRAAQTWSMEVATATTAYGCLNTAYQDAAGVPDGTSDSICYELDSASNIVGMRISISLDGETTLVFN